MQQTKRRRTDLACTTNYNIQNKDYYKKNSDTLNVVGIDGTASMMGNKAGFIRCLEEKLGRPLQWEVCLLHCSELPLRHVFLELDGTTKSPDSFSGPVGKKLNGKVST